MGAEQKQHQIELYNFPQSTCSQKVRLVLWEKVPLCVVLCMNGITVQGIVFTDRIVNAKEKEHRSAWYAKLNPNLVVPTITDNGEAIHESIVIIEYLDEALPTSKIGALSEGSDGRKPSALRCGVPKHPQSLV